MTLQKLLNVGLVSVGLVSFATGSCASGELLAATGSCTGSGTGVVGVGVGVGVSFRATTSLVGVTWVCATLATTSTELFKA